MFIKYDLLNTPEQRIPFSNSWTDSSDFARSLRREPVYLISESTLDIIPDVVIPQRNTKADNGNIVC